MKQLSLVTCVFLSSYSVCALADAIGGIYGEIKDKHGAPVPNAKVEIDGKSDFTDVDGRYRIQGLPTGQHKVEVEKYGSKVVDQVEVKPVAHEKNFSLMPP